LRADFFDFCTHYAQKEKKQKKKDIFLSEPHFFNASRYPQFIPRVMHH